MCVCVRVRVCLLSLSLSCALSPCPRDFSAKKWRQNLLEMFFEPHVSFITTPTQHFYRPGPLGFALGLVLFSLLKSYLPDGEDDEDDEDGQEGSDLEAAKDEKVR